MSGGAVTVSIVQMLSPRIKRYQEIIVTIMSGLPKLRQRVTRAFHLFAAHLSGNVKENSYRNRRVIVAKEGNVLLLLIVKDAECILAQTGNKSPVDIGHGHRERDQVGIGNDRTFVVYFAGL